MLCVAVPHSFFSVKGLVPELERINLNSIKRDSVRAIFHAITEKDKISRAEIAESTGLSLMTVGKVVDALMERGVTVQCRDSKNVAGRRARLVSLNTDKYFVILDLTSRSLIMMVMDIALNVVDRMQYDYNHGFFYEENLYIFMKNVKLYMLRHLKTEDMIGVGVILPGVYRPETDTVDSERVPELANTHVRMIIEDVLKLPVDALEKDVLAAAESNLSLVENGHERSIAYVCVGETVSGAMIVEGRLLKGRDGYAGDVGKLRVVGGQCLRNLFSERGVREETVSALALALSAEVTLYDPDILLVENCLGSRFDRYEGLFRDKLREYMGVDAEAMPQIRILEAGTPHAYRGMAIKMRQAWIRREIE